MYDSFLIFLFFFFFNDTATTEIYTLSLHDALPISIDDALHLEAEGALGALLEHAHARDVDGAFERAAFDVRADLVELQLERVGEDADHRSPDHLERDVEQHHRGLLHGAAEADDLAHDVGRVVERVVEDLLHPN